MERLLLHPLTHPPTITNIPRIDMWARVRSPGPLMADKARARVILYVLTSRSSGGEGEGVVRGKGSGGKREKMKKKAVASRSLELSSEQKEQSCLVEMLKVEQTERKKVGDTKIGRRVEETGKTP